MFFEIFHSEKRAEDKNVESKTKQKALKVNFFTLEKMPFLSLRSANCSLSFLQLLAILERILTARESVTKGTFQNLIRSINLKYIKLFALKSSQSVIFKDEERKNSFGELPFFADIKIETFQTESRIFSINN